MDDLATLDGHAHVWDRTCTYVPGARYRPAYQAPVGGYLRLLDAHGVERALLVQPSFLGTDNGYLAAATRAHPDRFRGIALIDPDVTDTEADDLAAAGIVGLRYNLLSLPPARLGEPAYRALTARAAARGWQIEVQANGPDWPGVLAHFGGVRVTIDHFGKPAGPDCPGLTAILARPAATTTVKLSAPYRQRPADMAPYARRLIERFGAARCLWGSDWPWTQHEGRHGYGDTRRWLTGWTTPEERNAMRATSPRLAGF